ncbi:MAG: SPOR domain-containing protein [Steroidobacteraceae bacterium]
MRFAYRAAGPIAAPFLLLLLLTACSRAQQDWRVAQQVGTAQAYEVFVARHPDSELASVARERAAQLTEQAAWQEATRANTVAAYRDYLATYPNGSWSQDARIRMESKALTAQAPQGTAAPAPAGSDQVPPTQPGSSAAASIVAPATAAAGRATVQLGAFSTMANAQSAWSQLSSRYRPQLQDMIPQMVPVLSSGRRLYRLEVRVADPAAARSLCRQLQQHSAGCLPVP